MEQMEQTKLGELLGTRGLGLPSLKFQKSTNSPTAILLSFPHSILSFKFQTKTNHSAPLALSLSLSSSRDFSATVKFLIRI